MPSERFQVRNVHGRYPHPALLQPANIEARTVEDSNFLVIRLDDQRYPEFWMELTLEITEHDARNLPCRRTWRPKERTCHCGCIHSCEF